jgi:hypothetical protein
VVAWASHPGPVWSSCCPLVITELSKHDLGELVERNRIGSREEDQVEPDGIKQSKLDPTSRG